MIARLKIFWKEKRSQAVLIIAVLMLALVSLYVNMGSIRRTAAVPAGDGENELRLRRRALASAMSEVQKLEIPLHQLAATRQLFWLIATDGDPATEFRKRIEAATQYAGLTLKSIGAMQKTKLADGVECCEITIAADGKSDAVLRFLAALRDSGKYFFWKNLTLNPDNIRKPQFLMLNGTIKIVTVEPAAAQKLWGEN
ncbi:MAG: hypothetical protein AB7F40_09630 [Victivallaceae bacterium]